MLNRMVVAMLALAVATVCVRLGVWQLDRHAERKATNAVIGARLAQNPIEWRGQPAADSLEFRRARASGVFDHAREVVQQGRAVNGVPAVYVVTPLVIADSSAILVERGWAPSPNARGVNLSGLREQDTSIAEGVLLNSDGGALPSDSSWPLYVRRADPSVLQPRFPYPLAPLVLRRTLLPPGTPRRLGLAPLPQLTAGPHLSYAIQWFAFATIAVVGPIVASGIFTRRSTRPDTEREHY